MNPKKIPMVFAGHPRHLPKPPPGRTAIVDVAFAAGKSYKKSTLPFLESLGENLVAYVDHHEHPAWNDWSSDARFTLVPNKLAHACPELVTPELVAAREDGARVDHIVAHADLDGLLAGAKWRNAGQPLWPEADEDARAVDSPGRGHALSARGQRLALALEEASTWKDKKARDAFLLSVADSIFDDEESLGLESEIESLGSAARAAREEAIKLAEIHGSLEADGVFVVRLKEPVKNRTRKHLLIYGEERARIGALFEPDPQGGAWVTAATFDQTLDLEEVDGFEGGRSDFRFARALPDGKTRVAALGEYLAGLSKAQ